MICEWGMSSKIGPLFFGKGKQSGLYRKNIIMKLMSIQRRVPKMWIMKSALFIQTAYKKAQSIIKEKLSQLHTMAEALLKFETIDSEGSGYDHERQKSIWI